jgi:hypothetical protein
LRRGDGSGRCNLVGGLIDTLRDIRSRKRRSPSAQTCKLEVPRRSHNGSRDAIARGFGSARSDAGRRYVQDQFGERVKVLLRAVLPCGSAPPMR